MAPEGGMSAENVVLGQETEYSFLAPPDHMNTQEGIPGMLAARIECDSGGFDNSTGGRLYNDRQLIEYATPECAGEGAARDLALWIRAGDEIILKRMKTALGQLPVDPEKIKLLLLKGATDWKNKWYGPHLDVRMSGEILPSQLISYLLPHLVSKIIWAGKGAVMPHRDWIDNPAAPVSFIFSPRGTCMRLLLSAGTTEQRGFLSTKSLGPTGSYDLKGWQRWHLLSNDSLFSDYITFIDAGLISLIVRLISRGGFPYYFPRFPFEPTRMEQASILRDFHLINQDPALETTLGLEGGESLTPLRLEKKYLEILRESDEKLGLTDLDQVVLQEFEKILKALEENPLQLDRTCECWFLRARAQEILERYHASYERAPLTIIPHKGKDISLSYYLLRVSHQMAVAGEEQGIWPREMKRNKVKTLFTPEEVAYAEENAPHSRAAFRKALFDLGRKAGIQVSAGDENQSWSTFWLQGYPAPLEKKDPTAGGNNEALKEAQEIIEMLKSGKTFPFDPPSENSFID